MSSTPRQHRASRVGRPTRRGLFTGIVGVGVIVIAYSVHRTEFMFLGWFAVLLPISAVLFVSLRRVRIEATRAFSSTMLVASHPAVCQLELRNLSPYASAEAHWRDALPWQPLSTPRERLAPIPGRSSWRNTPRVLRYELTPPRRGRFPVGPLIIELADPFGLARREVLVGDTQVVTVIPELERLPLGGLAMSADDGSASVQKLRTLGGDDDVMTRNYRPGDALRRVHWRASAHRGELMVREEEQRSHAEARIILDTRRRGYSDRRGSAEAYQARSKQTHGDLPQSDRFEWTLRLAATLALHLEQRGFLVQLAETGASQLASPGLIDEFLESVAAISLVPSEKALGESMRPHPRPDRSLGVIFAMIADAEPATIDSLLSQRKQFGLAVAFIATPHYDEIIKRLEPAGWRCVLAPPTHSVAPFWDSIAPLLDGNRATR